MDMRRALVLATAAALSVTVARSGHEQPVYPSYYPHEIEIADDGAAACGRPHARRQAARLCRRCRAIRVRAHPTTIGAVESLGSFVIVRLNPDVALAKNEAVGLRRRGRDRARHEWQRAAA